MATAPQSLESMRAPRRQTPSINTERRRIILAAGGCLVLGASRAGQLLSTPRQPTGPFYPEELPLDDDNDLTWVVGQPRRAIGVTTDLLGHVFDQNGRPVGNARIEIWQCDSRGRYRHPRDRKGVAIDPGFQGHGHTLTNATGRYRFRTIRPMPYPGRTPHIHVAVFPRGQEPLVTQLYVRNDPRNAGDFLFNAVPEARRDLVQADFIASTNPDVELQARFDLILPFASTLSRFG